jgi:hypothetical protein
MSTHSKLSPSSRHRWAACPASVKACEAYGESRSSLYATDGTHSHMLLEKCLTDGLPAFTYIDQELEDHDGKFVVDKARTERVQFALDYIASRTKPKSLFWAEQTVNPEKVTGRSDMCGTVDVLIITGNTIEIIDYKDGVTPVEAKGNPQLEQYAAGVVAEYLIDHPWDEITLTIIQPKLIERGESGISSHTITIDKLQACINKMILEAAATDDPDAPFVPGAKQCKYCAHSFNCPAMFNQTMDKAGIKFSAIQDIPQAAAQIDPATVDADKLATMLESLPMLRQLIELTEAEALNRLRNGKEIPGFKLVMGRGNRTWVIEHENLEKQLKALHVPMSEIYQTKIISPAQLEKLSWTNRKGEKKKLTDKQLEKILANAPRVQGKATVVPMSDKRPGMIAGVPDGMFSPVVAQNVELPEWLILT